MPRVNGSTVTAGDVSRERAARSLLQVPETRFGGTRSFAALCPRVSAGIVRCILPSHQMEWAGRFAVGAVARRFGLSFLASVGDSASPTPNWN